MPKAKWWCWTKTLVGTACLLPLFVQAQDGETGAFLRLGIGSRALSMGGAFTGVADDAAATYWNPAGTGISHPQRRQGMVMYRTLSLDRRQAAVAYTQNLDAGRGGAGFAFIHAGVDNIDGRDLNGQHTGMLSDSENAFLFSFSPPIHAKVSVGLTMKLLLYRLAGQTAKGFGGDVGLIVQPVKTFQVGFMVRDVATRLTWNTDGLFARTVERRETFPRTLSLGLSYRMAQDRLLMAADVVRVQRQDTRLRLGTEWSVVKGVAVRAGVDHGRPAAGVGFVTGVLRAHLCLNYVYLSDRIDVGETHVVEWEILF